MQRRLSKNSEIQAPNLLRVLKKFFVAVADWRQLLKNFFVQSQIEHNYSKIFLYSRRLNTATQKIFCSCRRLNTATQKILSAVADSTQLLKIFFEVAALKKQVLEFVGHVVGEAPSI
jgi:hypothetical protein